MSDGYLSKEDSYFILAETSSRFNMANKATIFASANQGTIGNPDASRAVGTAIGSNPVAFLIPCHRVIQSTGKIGGYRWGSTRKAAIIEWEREKSESLKR